MSESCEISPFQGCKVVYDVSELCTLKFTRRIKVFKELSRRTKENASYCVWPQENCISVWFACTCLASALACSRSYMPSNWDTLQFYHIQYAPYSETRMYRTVNCRIPNDISYSCPLFLCAENRVQSWNHVYQKYNLL